MLHLFFERALANKKARLAPRGKTSIRLAARGDYIVRLAQVFHVNTQAPEALSIGRIGAPEALSQTDLSFLA